MEKMAEAQEKTPVITMNSGSHTRLGGADEATLSKLYPSVWRLQGRTMVYTMAGDEAAALSPGDLYA